MWKQSIFTDLYFIYKSSDTLDKTAHIKNNKWLIHDITLPTIKDNPNIQCPNENM